MTALYQNQAIRQLEKAAFDQEIVSASALMQRAGLGAFHYLQKTWPLAKKITIICGKGNNAGDGFVIAYEAKKLGLSVEVFTLANHEDFKGVAKQAFDACISADIDIKPFTIEAMFSGDVIVDALLGTGLSGDVADDYQVAINAVNESSIPVLAIDVPSGLDANTGAIHGCAVKAAHTISFIAAKPGLYTCSAKAHVGIVTIDNLDLPADLLSSASPSAKLIDETKALSAMPLRHRDAHKGDFGHVLVIGGDYGMGGAVRMAAEAALRVGAGLVSVATRPEHLSVVNSGRPEVMCHQANNVVELHPLLEKASVIVIGPGLGQEQWALDLLQAVLSIKKPLVLDADALNLLSRAPMKNDCWVITPHPGEAARLLDITTTEVQADRYQAASGIVKKYGGVCVLKGSGTIVQAMGEVPAVCQSGNPGMATGGMGDVLSGVIGGLLAQGLPLFEAAKVGVVLHAKAADLAAIAGGERGLLASDLMQFLRQLVNT